MVLEEFGTCALMGGYNMKKRQPNMYFSKRRPVYTFLLLGIIRGVVIEKGCPSISIQ